jgi:hypothetical protein
MRATTAPIVAGIRSRLATKPKTTRESAFRDSRKNPVLASGDETRSLAARKFFHCQKLRLRVRAKRCARRRMSREEARNVLRAL